ncbi:hypothetical protein DB313_06035 (plasmid) [Borrelia turcica IST7]|uniref:Uncharacterized protein n=1 Tax=Borrelia turcica IST7 TaxID=1104446 RepID=A0A386PRF6_9SPIR|nr:hypothetical protein [Borrelia turcica]AYE37060.1 hypothetical protein DB313_06035 [Borrelia turcica IST7]
MSNTIAIRADQMIANQEYYNQINSEDILAVWNSYKALNNLGNMDSETERNIITLLKVNSLNPFKREAYIIPFGAAIQW